MDMCSVAGCQNKVQRAGHTLCYRHWKAEQQQEKPLSHPPPLNRPPRPAVSSSAKASNGVFLSSTKLGQAFDLSAPRINLILAELGWIEKYVKGWVPSAHGNEVGAEVRELRQSGVPYVVWPESILKNKSLLRSVRESRGEDADAGPTGATTNETISAATSAAGNTVGKAPQSNPSDDDFRKRFPAEFRSTDGHLVRSRAEMLIDNWLYMQGIVHAFERKLPIEEDVYCDFYLPAGKVYIEYWGMEADPKYADRMRKKQEIYHRYQLNLVELRDSDIMNLDDILPRMLLRFGVDFT